MIIDVLTDYLNNADLDAPVYTEIPKAGIPDEYYVIEQTGSPQDNQIDKSTIAIRSYAQSMSRAADLAYEMDNIMMNSLKELAYVSGVRRNTIANFTDLSTKQYRYQGVYVVIHY